MSEHTPDIVRLLQVQLGVPADGVWGPLTEAAYQQRLRENAEIEKTGVIPIYVAEQQDPVGFAESGGGVTWTAPPQVTPGCSAEPAHRPDLEPPRCPCGYGSECHVHCGNGHQTGKCGPARHRTHAWQPTPAYQDMYPPDQTTRLKEMKQATLDLERRNRELRQQVDNLKTMRHLDHLKAGGPIKGPCQHHGKLPINLTMTGEHVADLCPDCGYAWNLMPKPDSDYGIWTRVDRHLGQVPRRLPRLTCAQWGYLVMFIAGVIQFIAMLMAGAL